MTPKRLDRNGWVLYMPHGHGVQPLHDPVPRSSAMSQTRHHGRTSSGVRLLDVCSSGECSVITHVPPAWSTVHEHQPRRSATAKEMARAEKVAWRPGDNRCYPLPSSAAEAR